MNRQTGYYWIKLWDDFIHWEVAYYNSATKLWKIIGEKDYLPETAMNTINETPLTPPNE